MGARVWVCNEQPPSSPSSSFCCFVLFVGSMFFFLFVSLQLCVFVGVVLSPELSLCECVCVCCVTDRWKKKVGGKKLPLLFAFFYYYYYRVSTLRREEKKNVVIHAN